MNEEKTLKMKRPTLAQLWARDRNSMKWRLKGIEGNIHSIVNLHKTLTSREVEILIDASVLIARILSSWRLNSSLSKTIFLDKE